MRYKIKEFERPSAEEVETYMNVSTENGWTVESLQILPEAFLAERWVLVLFRSLRREPA